jgi:hypothetical protein
MPSPSRSVENMDTDTAFNLIFIPKHPFLPLPAYLTCYGSFRPICLWAA